MPAPVVYVAGAVITIAAAVAFKQFVYTPHIAPHVEAWRETRRHRQAYRRGPIAVPAMAEAPEESEPLVPQQGADGRHSDEHDGMSVELQDLVASVQAEWQDSSTQNTLRQRRPRAASVLDESNVFVPYDPISPTTATSVSSSATNSPMSNRAGPSLHRMTQLSSTPVIHSPLPRTPINPSRLQSTITAESLSLRHISPPNSRAILTPRVVSPAESSTVRSASTASSFTPAVIGPSSRSTTFQRATPLVSSPFADGHHDDLLSPRFGFNRSPSPVLLSPQDSSLHLVSESDMAILSPSLRSAMFSPSLSSFDGHFEIDSSFDGSDDGSDDSWSNVRSRTHSP